jgi:NAD-dependent dihydropyrimidine dehydrogenase PreA subunit
MGFRYLKNVTTLTLDVDKCNGCGKCTQVCPHAVFKLQDGKAQIVDADACMECGACAMNCEPEAITVTSGVGCAAAIIKGAILGIEPTCDCSSGSNCC